MQYSLIIHKIMHDDVQQVYMHNSVLIISPLPYYVKQIATFFALCNYRQWTHDIKLI